MPEKDTNKEWYSNKELFEMFQALKDELKITRDAVRKYNDIRINLNSVMERVTAIEQRAIGRYNVGKAIREWGGWIVAILSFWFTLHRLGVL